MSGLPPGPGEKRARVRLRTLRRGRVFYGANHAMSFDCVIRNLTEGGAMLRASATQPFPESFVLLNVSEGLAFDARLRWRRGEDAGVQFFGRHDLRGEVAEPLRLLKRVWTALAPD